jgi:DNA-binding NtrC family response regulator
MIVDDDPHILNILRGLLERWELEVIALKNWARSPSIPLKKGEELNSPLFLSYGVHTIQFVREIKEITPP